MARTFPELPEAPPAVTGEQIERRLAETHSCIRCGQDARHALVVELPEGPRWIDMCPSCGDHLYRLAAGMRIGIEPRTTTTPRAALLALAEFLTELNPDTNPAEAGKGK